LEIISDPPSRPALGEKPHNGGFGESMNIRRGMFRLWIVSSVLFVLGVSAALYSGTREEFRASRIDYDATAKKYGGDTLLPVEMSSQPVDDLDRPCHLVVLPFGQSIR
jgi:hypothetical protein